MKKLFSLIVFLGSVLLLGTAGASDAGTIDGSQIWLQVSISAVLIGGGYIGMEVIKKNASGTRNTESAQTKIHTYGLYH
ncbi:MAG TPA: hypothetical protein DD733_07560 [Clostridiales bacterium]|nr:hypothetical protein [Clostridiales bacterium]